MNYWVVLLDGAVNRGFFVRFESHQPSPRWFTSRDRQRAYTFASVEDAQHVVDQLKRYGRSAKVVTERPKAAPRTPSPPPRPVTVSPLDHAPAHLREWVEKLLNIGLISGKTATSTSDRVKTGYRMLAHEHHPDKGGSTLDMQHITEANAWLVAHADAAQAWFGGMSWHWQPADSIPDLQEQPMPFVTDDDIPF